MSNWQTNQVNQPMDLVNGFTKTMGIMEGKREVERKNKWMLETWRGLPISLTDRLADDASLCRGLYFVNRELVRHLDGESLSVLGYLLTHYKPDQPNVVLSKHLIAEEIGGDPRTVKRALKLLWWWGLIDFIRLKGIDRQRAKEVLLRLGRDPRRADLLETNIWTLKPTIELFGILTELLDVVGFPDWKIAIKETFGWVKGQFSEWLNRVGERPSALPKIRWEEIKTSSPFGLYPTAEYLVLFVGQLPPPVVEKLPPVLSKLLTKYKIDTNQFAEAVEKFVSTYPEFKNAGHFLLELIANRKENKPKNHGNKALPQPLRKLNSRHLNLLVKLMHKAGVKNPIAYLKKMSDLELQSYLIGLLEEFGLLTNEYKNAFLNNRLDFETFLFDVFESLITPPNELPKHIKGRKFWNMYLLILPNKNRVLITPDGKLIPTSFKTFADSLKEITTAFIENKLEVLTSTSPRSAIFHYLLNRFKLAGLGTPADQVNPKAHNQLIQLLLFVRDLTDDNYFRYLAYRVNDKLKEMVKSPSP